MDFCIRSALNKRKVIFHLWPKKGRCYQDKVPQCTLQHKDSEANYEDLKELVT